MGRKEENQSFECIVCKKQVTALSYGSYRNHCPFCLTSLHVDQDLPGDRRSTCQGVMQAIHVRLHTKKGWQIVHKCTKCHAEKCNKIVENDALPDDWDQIMLLT